MNIELRVKLHIEGYNKICCIHRQKLNQLGMYRAKKISTVWSHFP